MHVPVLPEMTGKSRPHKSELPDLRQIRVVVRLVDQAISLFFLLPGVSAANINMVIVWVICLGEMATKRCA